MIGSSKIGLRPIRGGGGVAPNLDFVSTWDTTQAGSASDTIVLPMTAGNTVHWGDGSSDTTNTHTYASGGTYTVTIEGAVTTFRFANSGDKAKITDISNWGEFDVSNNRIFLGCSNLDITATDYPTISTTDFYFMFANCVSLTTPDFSSWDVSSVTKFYFCFSSCTLFNGNLSNWDFSLATITSGMERFLFRCGAFNNSSVLTWNLNGVGGMPRIFQDDILFNQAIGIWDVSTITNMGLAFSNADAFDQDISSWQITQVSNFSGFLQNATGLSTANYDALLITWDAQGAMSYSGTVNFGGSQYSCKAEAARTSLITKWGGITDGGLNTSINCDFVSTWDTTQAGSASDTIVLPMTAGNTVHWGDGNSDTTNTHTYASSGVYTVTIEGAVNTFRFNNSGDKLKITDVSNWGGFDVSNDRTFFGCSNLDITATDYPTISGSNLQITFQNCSSLTTPDFSFWDVSSVTVFKDFFKGCSIFNGNISGWDMSSATNTAHMFNGCSVFDQNLGSWNMSSATNINAMFFSATSFNNGGSTSIDSWNTSNVTQMWGLFSGATLFNQPIGSWDVSNVTITEYAGHGTFRDATSFNQDISGWNTNSFRNISYMFLRASAFDQPIGTWNTSSITNMREAFRDATSFNQDISSWDINQVSNFVNFMFNATLSTANYDALLIAWDAQGVMAFSGTVNFGGSQYTSGGAAEAARTSLISKWGGIIDGGAV